MRLSTKEAETIRNVVHSFDRSARIYLFGSRTDDTKEGGDIDLLVESTKISFAQKLQILSQVKKTIGDQKIDLVISKSLVDEKDPFILSILDAKVEL